MTNEEVIEKLNWAKYRIDYFTYAPDVLEAIDIAIKALSQEPSVWDDDGELTEYGEKCRDRIFEQDPCTDAISREEAIDALYHHFCDKSRTECAEILHSVPPVIVAEKVGEWLETEVIQSGYKETWIKCSECGYDTALLIPKNYCPHCGAKMAKEE